MGGFEGGDEAGFWEEKPLFNLKEQQKKSKKDIEESLISISDDYYEIKVKSDESNKFHKLSFESIKCDGFVVDINGNNHKLDAFDNFLELLKEEGDTSIVDHFFSNYRVVVTIDETMPVTPAYFYAAFLVLANVATKLSLGADELKSLAASFDLQTGFVIENYFS